MPLIYYSNDHIIVGYANHILTSNIENITQIKEFISNEGKGNIVSIIVSSNKKYLIGSYSNKYICCWNLFTGELLGTCTSYKKPTALTTAILPTIINNNNNSNNSSDNNNEQEVLLISDKGGELWAAALPNLSKKVLLFSHTGSVITDTIITKTNQCPYLTILTADRDEKIRVTEFPATYSIQKYLLNHRDVLTTLSICEHELYSTSGYILSAGWDHKLNLWNKSTLSLADSIQLSNHINQVSSDFTTETFTNSTDNNATTTTTNTTSTINDEVEPINVDEIVVNDNNEIINDSNENNDNNENEENRAFDASKAGSFPMKVISSSTFFSTISNTSIASIAIIFWKLSEIRIYGIEEYQISNDSTTTQTNGKFIRSSINDLSASYLTITLPEPPIDCYWINNLSNNKIQLIVILPSPYCIQLFTLEYNSNIISNEFPFQYQLVDTTTLVGLNNLNDYIRNHECQVEQSLPFLEINAENEGIRKHKIDRPFDKTLNIDKKIEKSKRRKYEKK